jgi:homoserine kinase
MTPPSLPLTLRAPATTANLGPGFDCVAAAFDLWNELEITAGERVEVVGEGADELPASEEHLGVRAFARLAPAGGWRFRFTNRIPLERGLGSSAAAIALGLVAGALLSGRKPEAQALLEEGAVLEGHGDNLAAALTGGVSITWMSRRGARRVARIADSLPLVPLALIPSDRVRTERARAALPPLVAHADAAFSVSRAVLLGAGVASQRADLLADAFDDRLHEPFRSPRAPLLAELRQRRPERAVGATLSGSGPTVIVWTTREGAGAAVAELEERFPSVRVVRLSVSPRGAHTL